MPNKGLRKAFLLGTTVCMVMPVLSPSVVAQDTALEEVIVSATRRNETLQEVPVSVVSIGGDVLKKVGIASMADITAYVPGFEFASNSIQTNLYIRGIGSGPTHSIEQSVGRFVDELYSGRSDMSNIGFMDIGTVEVLRGPQGTLFGKNTVAGALVINTNNPTEEFEGGFSATYGKWSTVNDTKEFQAYVSGPVADNFRVRMAAKWKDDGGYVENVLSGPDSVSRRDIGVRFKADWDVSENTVIKFKAEYHNLEADGQPLSEQTLPSPLIGRFLDFVPASSLGLNWQNGIDCEVESMADFGGGNVVNAGSFCPFKSQDTDILSMTIVHSFENGGTLTSITGNQHYNWAEQFVSVDNGVSGGTFRGERKEDFKSFTQELRFASKEYEDYDFILGGYYENSTVDRWQRSHFNFVTFFADPGGTFITRNQPWTQDTETLAFYGQFRYRLSEDLSVNIGGRYSRETKDFNYHQFWHAYRTQTPQAGPPEITRADTKTEDNFSPSLQLAWDASDDLMLFINASKGYKSGGFSDRVVNATSPIEYRPETNTTIEAGVKATLLDGRLTTNLTLFNMNINDMQVASIIPGTAGDFTVGNAADATSRGAELELVMNVNEGLQLGGNVAYTDATFDEFYGECGSVQVDPQPDGTCSYAGYNLIYAPEFKGSVFADYAVDDAVGEWGLSWRGTLSFSGSYFTNSTYQAGEVQNSFAKIDSTLQLISPSENVRVSLIGRNLTNKKVLDWSILVGPTYFASLKSPRELAVRLSADF